MILYTIYDSTIPVTIIRLKSNIFDIYNCNTSECTHENKSVTDVNTDVDPWVTSILHMLGENIKKYCDEKEIWVKVFLR